MTYDGRLRRKRRRFGELFLSHHDFRSRAWAEELLIGIPFGVEDDDFIDEPSDLSDDDAIFLLDGAFQRSFVGRFTDAMYQAFSDGE